MGTPPRAARSRPPADRRGVYVFALDALSRQLGLEADAPADEARAAIGEAAVARGMLTAEYGR